MFCPECGGVMADDPMLDADQVDDEPCFVCEFANTDGTFLSVRPPPD